MSGKGQNVYPVEKLCVVWSVLILRYSGCFRQHLVWPATGCGQGNTPQSWLGVATNRLQVRLDRATLTSTRGKALG